MTKNEIEKSFGWKGLLVLKKLVNKKILYEDKKGFYKVTEGNKNIILSFSLLKAHLIFLLELNLSSWWRWPYGAKEIIIFIKFLSIIN